MSIRAKQKGAVSVGGRIVLILRKVVIYLLCIGIVLAAILFAADRSPQKAIFGYRFYTVLTPSMEPTMSVGDMVIVKLANADEIEVEDVITFQPGNDSDAYLTHRVTQKLPDYEGTGVTCFRTKGDANNVEDSFLIESSRVIGKVGLTIPKIGYFIRFVQLRWYVVVPLLILLVILLRLVRMYVQMRSPQEDADQESNDTPAKDPDNQKATDKLQSQTAAPDSKEESL